MGLKFYLGCATGSILTGLGTLIFYNPEAHTTILYNSELPQKDSFAVLKDSKYGQELRIAYNVTSQTTYIEAHDFDKDGLIDRLQISKKVATESDEKPITFTSDIFTRVKDYESHKSHFDEADRVLNLFLEDIAAGKYHN